ncbi:LPXTG-motif cell wall-anchored protein [Crossiella equi]|uniref:LPXTG-motif cell wall-anchored protein n=1 Tax=Crossiella equi TaxID=130796 RepID=A0ABS5AE98_9PSEU|nr:LPXTG cell wall anchor domain-containing protein [Crossiella equi]MBP2474572.1 LPXTG-motif cell wall-anchored protein [Crossiella equi]
MRAIARTLVTAALGAGLLLTGGWGATAAPSAGAPSAQDLAAASQAAANPSVKEVLGRFFQSGPNSSSTGGLSSTGGAPGLDAGAEIAVAPKPVPVFQLAKDFVNGTSAAPGNLAYVAVPATQGAASATLWTVRDEKGSWQVGNIAVGTREHDYAAKLPQGAYLLQEPQINAWYAVDGDQVRRLDAEAAPQSVRDYQRAVAGRYGDKQAGSSYAQSGNAGGYGYAATQPETGTSLPLVLVLVGSLLVLGLGSVFLRRRA